MTRVHPDGIFAVELPGTVLDYRVEVDGVESTTRTGTCPRSASSTCT